MNNSFLFLLMIGLFSCAKGNNLSDPKKINFSLFSSPFDPCLVAGKCTKRKTLPPPIALKMYEQSAHKTPPKLGQQVKRGQIITVSTTTVNNGNREEITCAIGFHQTRTIVRVESNEIYIKEEKKNFKFQPNIKECTDLQVDKEYLPLLIAIEDRLDLTETNFPATTSNDREQLQKLKMESLEFDNKKVLRISGVLTKVETYEDMNGNPQTITGELNILTMIDLDTNYFSSKIFEHQIIKVDKNLISEDVFKTATTADSIDVSNFNLEDYDSSLIDDRRDSN